MPGASLTVSTPVSLGKVQIVREGPRFTVRALKGAWVVGFVAQVMPAQAKSYPHLHLDYPDEIERTVVRNASRVDATVPALVRHSSEPKNAASFHAATIVDLSETRARFAGAQPPGNPDEPLRLRFQLTIAGGEEEPGLPGDVENSTERSGNGTGDEIPICYTGVKLRTLSRFQPVLLQA